MKIERGENIFYLDSTKLARYFDVKNVDAENLSTALCDKAIQHAEATKHAEKVDPLKRAHQYSTLIETRVVKNQSELAKYLGKSRAWVSKVMKVLEKYKS